ncbi:17661_t:CDS:2, partial [Gigaspora rosea]
YAQRQDKRLDVKWREYQKENNINEVHSREILNKGWKLIKESIIVEQNLEEEKLTQNSYIVWSEELGKKLMEKWKENHN